MSSSKTSSGTYSVARALAAAAKISAVGKRRLFSSQVSKKMCHNMLGQECNKENVGVRCAPEWAA